MKATVIVSCYKQELYIEDCLNSILNQEVDFDFDIIVADDCSPDSTQKILATYAKNFPDKIKLILRDKNVGAAINYIDAHNKAEGDIVFHFDGDDIMMPSKLQKQYDVFKKYPDVNIVFHRAQYFSDDGSYVSETGSPFFLKNSPMFFNYQDLALWGSITVHSSYAYRRNSRKTRYLNREFMEWFFAMDSLVPGGRGAYINEVLVKYRCNPSGAAYLSSSAGRKKSYRLYFEDVFHYYRILPEARHFLYANCLFTALAMAKAGFGIPLNVLYFLIINSFRFRPVKIVDVFKMRKSVAPAIKIR